MKITVLFNSRAVNDGLQVGWGFSVLIGDNIIFDTGEKGQFLFHNINTLGIDLDVINTVVISHDHWDHTGGLWQLLEHRKDVEVYACPGFSDEFKNNVRLHGGNLFEKESFYEITQGIWLTGEIPAVYKGQKTPEQAMIIDTERGLIVITGCAHPGIINMLNIISEHFQSRPLYAVMGGFHLINKASSVLNVIVETFKDMGIKKVGPTHCTGSEAEAVFRRVYRENFLSMDVGTVLDIGS